MTFSSIASAILIGIVIFVASTVILNMFGTSITEKARALIPSGTTTDKGLT